MSILKKDEETYIFDGGKRSADLFLLLWSAIMAEAKSAGKGSYVSLSMEDMKDSKDSEKDDEEEDKKSERAHTEETQSVMDDYLDEFNEVFRRKVRRICTHLRT